MEKQEWIYLDAARARFFRLGEEVKRGEKIGWSIDGREVTVNQGGVIEKILYDVDRGEIALALSPLQDAIQIPVKGCLGCVWASKATPTMDTCVARA